MQREADRQFHSLFITSRPQITKLADLRGKTFAFGDINSTSGHLQPVKEMLDAGIDPDKDLQFRYTGNHTATAIAVNGGSVDAGAIDETVYRKLVDDKAVDPAKVRVFFTSHPFVDYVWVVRKGVDAATADAIKKAFLGMTDPAVLDVLRATKYVVADDAEYEPLRKVAERLKLLCARDRLRRRHAPLRDAARARRRDPRGGARRARRHRRTERFGQDHAVSPRIRRVRPHRRAGAGGR